MKKYIRPTVEVVELSVKESLSALPGNMKIGSVTQRTAAVNNILTTYTLKDSSKGYNETVEG